MNPRRLGGLALCVSVALFAGSLLTDATWATLQAPSAIIQLTTEPGSDLRPVWSPDGRQIAFQSNRAGPFHIYVMNADGSNPRALTRGSSDDRHPVWLPDGKAILFDSFDGTRREIWSVNVEDGSRKQLTRLGALANFAVPSPDGKQIAFYVFQDETLDLWTARVDGSAAKPVTRNLASANNDQCTFACHPAAWSPDNQSLVYSSGDHASLWMMRGDGSHPTQIVAAENEHDHFPWFLADGRLAFITEHIEPAQAWTDAWAYDLNSRRRTLLQGRMSVQGPMAWSADTTKVLFHSPRSGNFDIYLVDLNAPGGVQALQGAAVPVELAPGAGKADAPTPSSPGVSPAADPDQTILVIGLGVVALASIGVLGLLIWRRARRQARVCKG
jgi:Tol biopolymer transport system component